MMFMPFYPNTTAELWAYNEETMFDEYGDPLTDYTFRETVEADIQPVSPTSSLKEFGKILQDTYKLYLDINTEIHDTDRIIIDDKKYEIIGSVEVWNHILKFKKVTIRLQRK